VFADSVVSACRRRTSVQRATEFVGDGRSNVIEGVVLDASTNDPLPQAFVSLVGQSGTTRSSAGGAFVMIDSLPTRSKRVLRVQAIGHETRYDTLSAAATGIPLLRIYLSERRACLEPLTVGQFHAPVP
jgi:hypothetical protein